jgi:HlyD family secretion protein
MNNSNDNGTNPEATPQVLKGQIKSDALVVQGADTSALVENKAGAIASQNFDQPLVLRQSPKWTQAILWTLVGSVTFGLIWASVAKIEESVPAQGKLEPQGAVKEVRAPANGVLKEILVKEGERVTKDQVILRTDPTAAQAQLDSLKKLRKNLQDESQFYRSLLNGDRTPIATSTVAVIPADVLALARSRDALISEQQLYRMQVSGGGASLSGDQQDRLLANQAELSSRSYHSVRGTTKSNSNQTCGSSRIISN